ncbi:Rap1-interacting factor 1 N terminal-domain-containing protein [Aspergillus desertorum]
MVDVLGPSSARPPTPPRTASRMLSEKDRTEDSPVPIHTPNESPFLQNDSVSTGAPSSRQSKRVNFSPWPKFIKAPSFTNPKSKALLPSNDLKPTRSILKATNSPGPVSLAAVITYTPESFVMLLESVTQQLAGESTSSKIDAYMQFFGALRAYEKLPTEEEIMRKLSLIAEFIQRDISRDLSKGDPLDTNLVIQALKLSVVLVWHPQISPQLPDEFKLFLVEHSVVCLENGNLPKSVMTHYLTVLSTQKFPARIITAARTTRILEMLHGLTDRVKGNSVVSQRLMIYERLFDVSKQTFLSLPTLWMDHLISGLLHQIKNVRLNALELGFNAYMASGSNSTLSKTLRDIFDRPLANNRKLVSEVSERMSRMMANPETGEHVPQVWGVITLLLRSKRFSIDQWQHFKEWVLILQKCFNCNDPEIKSKAIGNWNRFVLVANISDTTSQSLLRMLSKPILSQFERKKHDKTGSQPSQLVVASYYNLLYYAFRPDASHQQLDKAWEEYIFSPSSNIFSCAPSLSDRLAHALSHMLWSSHPLKAWSDNRVNEPKRIVPEELPPLDPKWVRSRIPEVLKVFEAILKSSVWGPEMERSNIAAAWLSLSHALAFAASKEITPSPESMLTVAHVLGLLQRLWNGGPSSLNAADDTSMDPYFERFRFLSTTMIIALGSIPFTEKLLLKTADSYQAATPTHRHPKGNNNPDSPILHLLRLLSDVSGISAPTAAYSRLIKEIVEAACHGKVSRGSRLDILRQCADLYPDGNGFHGVDNFAQVVWTSAAQLTADCLCSFAIESARERDGSITRDYDNALKILSTGLKYPDSLQVWDQLLGAFIRVLRDEKGDCAIAAAVLDPLVGLMMNLDIRTACSLTSSIIHHCFLIPFSACENGANDKNTLPFPTALVGLAHRVLSESYELLVPLHSNVVVIFIETLVSFLGSGTFMFRSLLLDQLQYPLGLILKDESRKLTAEDGADGADCGIVIARHALVSAVLDILQILPRYALTSHKFEQIICSGLESSHISTANRFRDFLKSSFGSQQSLIYPASISQALRDLEVRVGVQTQRSSADTVHLSQSKREVGNAQGNVKTNGLATESSKIAMGDASVKPRIAFILDAPTESPCSARFESPVIGSDLGAPALQQTTESSLQQALSQEGRSNPTSEAMVSSGKVDTSHHKEMFSMIDNLRSSSPPTTTPRQPGFMTPPHIRNLRNEESESETPQTPTIPAVTADNEDGFLGSSPTPAIRGRTSSVASTIPPSFHAGDSMDIDPPSSPPELDLQSVVSRQTSPSKSTKDRSAKNKKKNKPRRSKTPSKRNSSAIPSQSGQIEQNNEGEVELSMKSRLRSATDKSSAKNGDEIARQAQNVQEAAQFACNDSSHDLVPAPNSKLNNVSEPQLDGADLAMDLASEDTDTQATSQLEHDLVYAVDLSSDMTDGEAAVYLEKAAVIRKRKREEETWTTSAKKERRRSSRISAATPAAEAEETQSASKKQKLTATPRETASSPANPAAKKRQHEPIKATAETPEKGRASTGKETEKEPGSQGSQKRRSHRISGVPAPDIPEENPAPKKSPRPSSSQKQKPEPKQHKKQKNRKSERRLSQRAGASQDEIITEKESSMEKPVEQSQHSTVDIDSEQQPQPTIAAQVDQPGPQPSQQAEASREPKDTQMAEPGATEPEPAAVTEAEGAKTSEPQLEIENPAVSDLTESHQPLSTPDQPTSERAGQSNQDIQISTSLRSLINQVKVSSLDRNTVKEMDELLFDLRVEMHEALRRHRDRDTTMATSGQ